MLAVRWYPRYVLSYQDNEPTVGADRVVISLDQKFRSDIAHFRPAVTCTSWTICISLKHLVQLVGWSGSDVAGVPCHPCDTETVAIAGD